MRRVRTYHLIFALAGLCLVACDDDEPADVITSRSNATADFTSFDTFAIADEDDVPADVQEQIPDGIAANLDMVNDAVRTVLVQQGLREVDRDDEPDLIAFSLAATQDVEALYWTCVDSYWYGYWSYVWTPCAWLAPVYTEYTQGSVVIALADPVAEDIVFGGVIQGVIEDEVNSADAEERINEDVDELFEDYPADQTGE
jgi:hypothetical protein